jgi:hypothetical protein
LIKFVASTWGGIPEIAPLLTYIGSAPNAAKGVNARPNKNKTNNGVVLNRAMVLKKIGLI